MHAKGRCDGAKQDKLWQEGMSVGRAGFSSTALNRAYTKQSKMLQTASLVDIHDFFFYAALKNKKKI